jgi:hypothetical protein
MAEPPDLSALAKRYVDLWQDQLIAMAADPALAEGTARLLAALVPAGWPPGQTDEAGQAWAAAAPRTAAAGPPFDERDGGMVELARRLAALEKRLAAMETRIRDRGGSAKPRARAPRKK